MTVSQVKQEIVSRLVRGPVALVCVGLSALALAPMASATSYEWSGIVGPTRGNGNCYWYSGKSACSGWNYWYQLNASNAQGNGGEVHVGFQNTSVIRGTFFYAGDSGILYPGDFNMGGYLKSGITWCDSSNWNCQQAYNFASVWFKTWA